MKVVIIEDEYAAAKNLTAILQDINPGIEIQAILESVEEAVGWFSVDKTPDLAFFDIQLADDSAFNIFNKVKINCPIIFTTAYNQYAVKAFKVNSIDYILKPVNREAVRFALNKFLNLKNSISSMNEKKIINMLSDLKSESKKSFKKTFLVHYKDRMIPVDVNVFAYFFIDYGIVYGMTYEKKKYVIDQKLELLQEQLDPESFFRANRQYIVSRKAIKDVGKYFSGKFSLNVRPESPDKIIISKARAPEIKKWLEE
ncbi:MAG: LytTR family DNA-binding domain-containing protein [Bacteroidales bacterium]|nr:LytTR family DNA-binding domain-containing protein [Bacteroidales bacterium]MCF8344479.1 LytTR family DNA-binding domain-containing protein [Bacteroidales bacterium]MCF8352073.1 LytTR family DNA-binding domain-containing protein [Bacteroidales bacterium]MCF8377349.1 LytTR family DNA-binding domain-containing protein [Bacteroidales bacterium]MCF8401905.1 LytTR family DNA-binding domain-containing protein [Bacteroidales bacterium]